MRVVEFLGAPGIGKSTLYREVMKQLGKGTWLTPSEARMASYRELTESRLDGWYYSKLKSNRFAKSASQLTQRKLRECVNSVLDDSVACQQFLSQAMCCFEDADIDALLKLRMIYDWYNVFTARVLFGEIELDQWVAVDESLTKKGLNFLTYVADDKLESAIHDYYEAVPFPEVVVHCHVELPIAVERINQRRAGGKKKVAFTHRQVSDENLEAVTGKQQFIARRATEILISRGSRVIEVDLSKDRTACRESLLESLKFA